MTKGNANVDSQRQSSPLRIRGPIGQPIGNETYKHEFVPAEQLAVMDHPGDDAKLITRDYWRRELEYIPDPLVPRKTLDFIESILIIDPRKMYAYGCRSIAALVLAGHRVGRTKPLPKCRIPEIWQKSRDERAWISHG